jgi:hypothetical protein
MNIEGNIQKKPLNYGRDGEGYIDLKKAKYGTMKELIKGKIPENKEAKAYDLAGNLVLESDEKENTKISPEKIDAITKNIKSQVDLVLAKEVVYQSQGIDGDKVEKLLDMVKQEILEQSGVSEEMYIVNEGDAFELIKSKEELKKTVAKFDMLGKLSL